MKRLVIMHPHKRRFNRPQHRRRLLLIAGALASILTLGALLSRFAVARGGVAGLRITSYDFSPGGFIPSRYTCSGQNVSPELAWSEPPADALTFALTVTDPDAPGHTFTHWVAFNLPLARRNLSPDIPKTSAIPGGGLQGINDFRRVGYDGPCPPHGNAHHYLFKLYALNIRLGLRPGATRREVELAMKGHVLAQAELTGLYGSH